MVKIERSVGNILKRAIAWIICIVMMLAVMPFSTLAATEEEHQRIRQQISDVYRRTLSATGASSLHGYCGMMAGWELYLMGITTSAVTRNGNEMYDVLKVSDQIAEGYTPVCYPATEYSLEEALNAVSNYGSKDVYNIVLGFQWTTTAAGRYYGHVTVVHAILDGMVYFTEGFVTPFQSDPSQAMVCTIAEFAKHYDGWTGFEGLIHFDSGIAVAGCDTLACDLFVAADTEITLLSRPDFIKAELCRTVPAGEKLHAAALCRNWEGVLFYQIIEENREYYIPADQVKPVWFDGAQVKLQDSAAKTEKPLSAILSSERLPISNVAVHIANGDGETVLYREVPVKGTNIDLKALNVELDGLPEGVYTLSLYCDLENPYGANGEIIRNLCRVSVAEEVYTVGAAAFTSRTVTEKQRAAKNGWQYEAEAWYYYENGICRTGWFCDNGIDYYLLPDGAAATGWQEINGKNRYFSETGAMRTGWLETADGTYYMLSNGVAATGETTIADSRYVFTETGLLMTEE